MKSGFKDPIAIKNQHPKDSPKDAKSTWWDCPQPQYDQRSSNFVNVGTHYGTGHNQPVGRAGNPQQRVSTLPYGRVNTMKNDEKG